MPPSEITGTSVLASASATFGDRGDLRHADAGDDARRADRARADADLHARRRPRRPARARLRPSRCCRRSPAGRPTCALMRSTRVDARRVSGRARCRRRRVDARFAQRRDAIQRVRRRCRPPRRRAARPRSSLQARGNSVAFWKSFTVIMPRELVIAVRPPAPSRCGACAAAPSTSSFGAFSRTVIEPLLRRHHRGDGRVELRPRSAGRDA